MKAFLHSPAPSESASAEAVLRGASPDSRDIYVMVLTVRQETKQAAANKFPPPVYAAEEDASMTVTYQQTADDLWHLVCYLSYKTVGGRIIAVFFLLLPLLLNLLQLYLSPIHSPSRHLLSHHFWFMTTCTYLGITIVGSGSLYWASSLPYKYCVTISKDLWVMQSSLTYKSSWRDFARIVDEDGYFYLIGWRRVAQIPKRAFCSPDEAGAFFETALTYWRNAKGIPLPPVPETVGVWPPPPRPGNSAEPGDTP